jgi:hypothetical protein
MTENMIPIVVVDTTFYHRERVIFVDKPQLLKKHIFLPVTEGCFARVEIPQHHQALQALVLSHKRGLTPRLIVTTTAQVMNRVRLVRLLCMPQKKTNQKKNHCSSRLGKHLTC